MVKVLTNQGLTEKIQKETLQRKLPKIGTTNSTINEAETFYAHRYRASAGIIDDSLTLGVAPTLLDRVLTSSVGVYETLMMLSDILPVRFKYGMLNGKVLPGSTLVIIGAGPIGLAVVLIAQFYEPAQIIVIDVDDSKLEVASRFGATEVFNSTGKNVLKWIKRVTGECGVGTVVETARWLTRYELCQKIVAVDGLIIRTWASTI